MKVPSFLLEKLNKDELWQVIKWLRETNFPEFVLEEAVNEAFQVDLSSDETEPRYYRDCPDCVFMGNFKGKSLYYCTNPRYAKTIVHETNDVVFGVRTYAEDDEWYIEAENRAMLRGFLPGLVEKNDA